MTITTEQRERAVKRLHQASRQASAASEAFIRWSYMLKMEGLREEAGLPPETDGRYRPLALIQKALNRNRGNSNPVLALLAMEVLREIAPERIEASLQMRAKRKADDERWSLRRHMAGHAKKHGDEALRKIVTAVLEQHERTKHLFLSPEPEPEQRYVPADGNVVTFPGR